VTTAERGGAGSPGRRRRIYLDHAATTPVDPRVLQEMLPYFVERFGNPSSREHAHGWEAEEAVEIARGRVAALFSVEARDVIFTSGATEANNLALKGVCAQAGRRGHLIVSGIEHSSVLQPALSLEREGLEVTRIPPDRHGVVDPERIGESLREDTLLVSVVHGNNETGVIQDLPAIARRCRAAGVLFHSDATQTAGKVPYPPLDDGPAADLTTLSGHKLHGPKGAGALVIRGRARRARLRPLLEGGGQEHGVRSGTLNVPAIVGFGMACQIAGAGLPEERARLGSLRDRFEAGVRQAIGDLVVHGDGADRAPHVSNLHVPGVEVDALMHRLHGVALASGSACSSGRLEPSHVLLAMGCPPEEARNSLRCSVGRFTTAEEVDSVIEMLIDAVRVLRP